MVQDDTQTEHQTTHEQTGDSDAVRQNVNDLLTKLQSTDDPQEARSLSAQLNEEVAKLPG